MDYIEMCIVYAIKSIGKYGNSILRTIPIGNVFYLNRDVVSLNWPNEFADDSLIIALTIGACLSNCSW